MTSSLPDLITEIHVASAASVDGKYTLSEASLSETDRITIEQASVAGWIDVMIKDDFGDYYILSVTDKGRREFRLLAIERKTLFNKVLAFLSPAQTKAYGEADPPLAR